MAALKNIRQERFANFYARGVERREAYRLAGFVGRPSAQSIYHFLKQPHIQARIAELTAKAAAKTEFTVARVIRELAKIAFCDLETSPLIPASVKRQALVDLGKHLRMFEPDFNVNALVINQNSTPDAAALERIMVGLLEARRERERAATIEHEPAGGRNADAVDTAPRGAAPLRLVEPPVPPPSEDKPQSTTEAYLEWTNRPPKP
jgi:hypothetical protein